MRFVETPFHLGCVLWDVVQVSDVSLVVKKINLLVNGYGGKISYFYPINLLCAMARCLVQKCMVNGTIVWMTDPDRSRNSCVVSVLHYSCGLIQKCVW